MKRSFKLNSEFIRTFVVCICIVIAIIISVIGVIHKNNNKKQSLEPTKTITTTEKSVVKTAATEFTTKEGTTTEVEIESTEELTSKNQIEYTNIETTKINKKEEIKEEIVETTKKVVEKTTEKTVEKTTEKTSDETKAVTEAIVTTTEKEDSGTNGLVSLGQFKLTAYCNCSKCCGKWAGSPTASGVMPRANHTIAVDTSVIPFGTEVIINGNTYVAEDTGSAIRGNKIDIYMSSHEEALNFGVQYAEVLIVNK